MLQADGGLTRLVHPTGQAQHSTNTSVRMLHQQACDSRLIALMQKLQHPLTSHTALAISMAQSTLSLSLSLFLPPPLSLSLSLMRPSPLLCQMPHPGAAALDSQTCQGHSAQHGHTMPAKQSKKVRPEEGRKRLGSGAGPGPSHTELTLRRW